MILAHHRPWLDLSAALGNTVLTVWFLYHVKWTHRGWRR